MHSYWYITTVMYITIGSTNLRFTVMASTAEMWRGRH